MSNKNYKFTLFSCCFGSVLTASIANISPLLFIPLKEIFALSYAELGLLVSANFVTQLVCDFSFGALAERFGIKNILVLGPVFATVGFLLFALSPYIFAQNIYLGFILATVLFSMGGGVLETLMSPVVSALPTENKAASVSIVHSFYAWGQSGVVILTTMIIKLFGRQSWQIVYFIWAFIGIISFILFAKSPIINPQKNEKKSGALSIFKRPMFILAVILMFSSGAAELGLSQWSSSFMEKGLGIPKEAGDVLGMCLFGVMMGLGRMLYVKASSKVNTINVLLSGAFFAIICYLVVGLTTNPVLSLMFCALCGLCVCLLWPCTLTICSDYFPYGGTMMFAILACGGDAGCALGPWALGKIIDISEKSPLVLNLCSRFSFTVEQLALRIGIFSGAIFPLIAFLGLIVFKYSSKKNQHIL